MGFQVWDIELSYFVFLSSDSNKQTKKQVEENNHNFQSNGTKGIVENKTWEQIKKYAKIKTLYLVDVHVWVHVLVCASVNGGQKSTFKSSSVIFETKFLTETGGCWLTGQDGHQAPGPVSPTLELGLQVCITTPDLHTGDGNINSVFHVAQQALYQQSHVPSPLKPRISKSKWTLKIQREIF